MKKTLICLFALLASCLSAIVHFVDINGGGQFTSIQAGIAASANGDTVLVSSGIYLENIDYSGKSITVASLELTTGNPAYRDSTIIDGNSNGSCVKVATSEANCTLYGFTVMNGSGSITPGGIISGGGIYVKNCGQMTISNCTIRNNLAQEGGGLYTYQCTIWLNDTLISNNFADAGGGIFFYIDSFVMFNTQQRCSVYENYAGSGNDIFAMDTHSIVDVVLDTATIAVPDDYYIIYNKTVASTIGGLTFDIIRGNREEVNHDLYVSPTGNDSNTGFTPDEPLKTIAWALHKIAPDSLNPKTIYVAAGEYSTDDGQIYPLSMKSHTRLIGDPVDRPIIRNNRFYRDLTCRKRKNAVIRNFIKTGTSPVQQSIFSLMLNDGIEFSNIDITDVAYTKSGSNYYDNKDLLLKDINIRNVTAYYSPGFTERIKSGRIVNLRIDNCHSIALPDEIRGRILDTIIVDSLYVSNVSITNCTVAGSAPITQITSWQYRSPKININNMLVANNSTAFISAILLSSKNFEDQSTIKSNLSNCTFVNNTAGQFGVELGGRFNVNNCIISNNTPYQVYVPSAWDASTIMNFNYNLIEGFPQSVIVGSLAAANYIAGNFDADPSFAGTDWTDPLSYRLNYNSPCIDAGTPDTTGLYLPEFDLFGNPRIYNGIIDIGCYEWDGTGNEDEYAPNATIRDVIVYPNPFNQIANIAFYLPKDSDAKISIYNTRGQLVREIGKDNFEQGYNKAIWDGKDMNGRDVSNGVYLLNLKSDGVNIVEKCILLK